MKIVASALLARALAGCSGTPQDRQESADQRFGRVKVGYVIATLAVSVYNQLPVCGDDAKPPLCYSEHVGRVIDQAMQAAALAITTAEQTFAAGNADVDGKLKAANVAKVVVENLITALSKFGLSRLGG
jgi:hypothetical protein